MGCVALCSGCCSSQSHLPGDSRIVSQEILSVYLHDVQGILATPPGVDDPRGELLGQKLHRLLAAAEAALTEPSSIPLLMDSALASIRFRLNATDSQTGLSFYVPATMTFNAALDMLCGLVDARWLVEQGRILVIDSREVRKQSNQAFNVDFPGDR